MECICKTRLLRINVLKVSNGTIISYIANKSGYLNCLDSNLIYAIVSGNQAMRIESTEKALQSQLKNLQNDEKVFIIIKLNDYDGEYIRKSIAELYRRKFLHS